MSSGSSTPQNIVTTQNKDPWAGAQPALGQALSMASGLASSNSGYVPYSGATQADLNPSLAATLGQTDVMAHQDIQNGGGYGWQSAGNNALNVINNQGITPGIQGALSGLGQANNIYGNIAGLNGGLNQNQYNTLSGLDVASGLYGNMYGEANGQTNPYLQSVLDAQGRKIADQVNSTMSGAGRYGSGAHTNVLSRNLAEAADPILAQDYQNRQQTKLAALQGQSSVYGQKLAALQQGLGNQFAGAQGMGGLQGQIAGIYGNGLNQAGQYSQLLPTIDQMRYTPNDRATSIGNYYQDRAQQQLQGQIDYYNAGQARDWEQVARLNAIASGAGGLGGSSVSSAPNLNAPVGGLQGGLGGALAGGAAGSTFGPYGAALGALGGGLLGAFR